jgi:hypothetical protein
MKIRISIGEFLLIIPLPEFTEPQRKMLRAIGISIILNALLIAMIKLIGSVHPDYRTNGDPNKMVVMNLNEDEEIKKAKELFENPRANRIKPNRTTILSDVNSKSNIETLPKDMTINPIDEGKSDHAARTDETEKTDKEDEFRNNENVIPFISKQKQSVLESITKSNEGQRGWGGQTYELNTYQWNFAPYMLKWKNRMTGHWYKITSRINFNPYAPLGSMRIYVKLDRQGRLLDSKILDYNCDRSFVSPAYASVLNSFPLDPLPGTFPDDILETTWTITITN